MHVRFQRVLSPPFVGLNQIHQRRMIIVERCRVVSESRVRPCDTPVSSIPSFKGSHNCTFCFRWWNPFLFQHPSTGQDRLECGVFAGIEMDVAY